MRSLNLGEMFRRIHNRAHPDEEPLPDSRDLLVGYRESKTRSLTNYVLRQEEAVVLPGGREESGFERSKSRLDCTMGTR